MFLRQQDLTEARTWRRPALRALGLVVTGVSLYVLAPSLIEVFASWRTVVDLSPGWLAAVALLETASFVFLWDLQRITLRTRSWFVVGASQLAGSALGHIVPGGLATASAMQFQMLTRASVPGSVVASGLAASSVLTAAMVMALPVLAVPAVITGAPIDRQLFEGLVAGLVAFCLLVAIAAVFLATTRPLSFVAGVIQGVRRTQCSDTNRGRPASRSKHYVGAMSCDRCWVVTVGMRSSPLEATSGWTILRCWPR